LQATDKPTQLNNAAPLPDTLINFLLSILFKLYF
jgi:hypothetical protein